MKASPVLAALLTFTLGLAARGAAQGQPRRGFWLAFGAGYSSLASSCDGCGSLSSQSGIAGQFRMGTTLRPNLLVGLDLESWNKSEGGKWARSANFTAAAYWYPSTSNGFYVKGGAGLSTVSGTVGGYAIDGTGFGLTGGLGYDLRLTKGFFLTPVATYFWGSVGDISTGSIVVSKGWKQSVLNLGLDATLP